jgi:gentisate 1,2-dioxygenase
MASDRTEKLAQVNFWNELLALRDRQREQQKTAVQVVRRSELPPESNSQGLMRWYLHPAITDTVLSTLTIFEQELAPRSRSGRLKFQGGQVMFIIEGEGYTIVDGVRHPWMTRDVLNLPLKKDGIIVQHFNSSADKGARFLVVEPNLFTALSVDRGAGFEQLEAAPDFKP